MRASSLAQPSQKSERVIRFIFFATLVLLCLWVLHLPLFPMQDGPMHLYLAGILGDLLTHSPSAPLYAQFYTVQHLLPPYSLHYYLLILLMKAMPALWAEKTVVCIILIAFCCGVRSLARANGPSGNVLSLFSFAFALNWPLMMGFQNYVLSLAIACCALAIWTRQTTFLHRAAFVGCCWLAAITHPLPLLLVLGFAAVDLVLRAASSLKKEEKLLPARWSQDALAFLSTSTLLLYLRAFTDKHRSAQDMHVAESPLTRLHYFIGLHGLDFFRSNDASGFFLRLALYVIVAVCIALGLVSLLKQRSNEAWKPAHTWFIVTALLTIALPFLPDDLSGSKALVSRLQVVSWIGFIAAASGFVNISKRWITVLTAFAVVAGIGSIALAQARLMPVAQRIFNVSHASLPAPGGSRGLLLSARAKDSASFADVTYEPIHWQAAAYFRRSHSVLLNTPWMDSTWLPLAAGPGLLTKDFDPWMMECYDCLRQQLVGSSEVRKRVLSQTDFIAFIDQPGSATQSMLDEVLKLDPAYQWACRQYDWLWLCQKRQADS